MNKKKVKLKGSALVCETIRDEIISGALAPGAALPPHLELAKRFNVSNVTVQQGLSRLADQGVIEVRPRVGSFVSRTPPHLNDYGLVFWNDPDALMGSRNWSRYFQALAQAAARFEMMNGRRMLQFHGIDQHTDAPDRQRLIERLETQRLAGLIFANIPFMLEGSPILERQGIPRVAFETASQYPHVLTVNFDKKLWLAKALDYLAEQGRSRVAFVEYGHILADDQKALSAALAERNMVSYPRWQQFAGMDCPAAARHAVELLMHDRERPDALLVTDDNLVEPALAGLMAAGVRVHEDVVVIGHANWPVPPSRLLPARLLGFDLCAALLTCVEIIDKWRGNKKPPEITTIPALWEEELDQN